MILTRRRMLRFRTFALLIGAVVLSGNSIKPAHASTQLLGVTQEQMMTLLPNEQDLQGFVRIRPASDTWDRRHSEALQDGGHLNRDLSTLPDGSVNRGSFSRLSRALYSSDGVYGLSMEIKICDSPETAQALLEDYLHSCQAMFRRGTFSGTSPVGDESWVPMGVAGNTILYRYGKVMVNIHGFFSFGAAKEGIHIPFPPEALEAVANMVLLRASRQASLIGISAQAARVAVNGKPLGTSALMTGKQVYVPVAEFAKAMGMQSQWDAKTGALTLTRTAQKPITLTAGSTAGKVGTTTVALQTPVLKEAGQPVMTLQDLLMLTGGRIVSQKGNVVQVKA